MNAKQMLIAEQTTKFYKIDKAYKKKWSKWSEKNFCGKWVVKPSLPVSTCFRFVWKMGRGQRIKFKQPLQEIKVSIDIGPK